MATPKVFISSTFFDLRHIRNDVDNFIRDLGYEPIRNEEGGIAYGSEESLEDYCYKEIKNVDIFVSIIGGRFGTESKKSSGSISQTELKTALKAEKQVYIFIEKSVMSEFETYKLNRENENFNYKYVDNVKIYEFIDEIKSLSRNNNIKGFETGNEIVKYLRIQFAGLFQSFLENQGRLKEVRTIDKLENTAETLNKLVTYLEDGKREQNSDINRILMINHPLVEELKETLEIPYNFYIDGIKDLSKLLKARGFDSDNEEDFIDVFADAVSWTKVLERRSQTITISTDLFDGDGKLQYIKKTDWKDTYFLFEEEDIIIEEGDDDLPF